MCNFPVRWWHVKLQIKSETVLNRVSLAASCLVFPFKSEAQSHPPGRHALVLRFKLKRHELARLGRGCFVPKKCCSSLGVRVLTVD